mmetsp:Transcript_5556/g.17546  ORF Transcript_5556/g.17546 Transcript_5556/m.17546 type:complete len:277 (+) Transcript_5556:215-1045(+)
MIRRRNSGDYENCTNGGGSLLLFDGGVAVAGLLLLPWKIHGSSSAVVVVSLCAPRALDGFFDHDQNLAGPEEVQQEGERQRHRGEEADEGREVGILGRGPRLGLESGDEHRHDDSHAHAEKRQREECAHDDVRLRTGVLAGEPAQLQKGRGKFGKLEVDEEKVRDLQGATERPQHDRDDVVRDHRAAVGRREGQPIPEVGELPEKKANRDRRQPSRGGRADRRHEQSRLRREPRDLPRLAPKVRVAEESGEGAAAGEDGVRHREHFHLKVFVLFVS